MVEMRIARSKRGHAALIVACAGCFAHRPSDELLPGAPVSVEFAQPTTLAAVAAVGLFLATFNAKG